MSTEPLTTAGSAYREAVEKIDALVKRWQKIHPQELASGAPNDETTLYLGVRHLRGRDATWDQLFRAIDGLERSTTQREAAQERA